jgi:hypothetical protein
MIVYKLHKLRVFVSLVFPAFLSLFLFVHFYFFGGTGAYSKGEIERQPGVSVIFDEAVWKSMPAFEPKTANLWSEKVSEHPRSVFFDVSENALFASYGNSYFENNTYPSILRVDLPNKKVDCFISQNVQRASFHGPTVIVAPWGNVIYELSKKDLSIMRKIPSGQFPSVSAVQAMDVYYDAKRDAIFLGNEIEQMLAKYDYKTGKLLDYLDLVDTGLCIYGGPLQNITESEATGKLYFTAGPGETNLFEVSPDTLKLTRSLKLGDLVGSSIVIDDDNQLIYYQAALSDSLYEVSLKDFQVIRVLKGSVQSRYMCIDKERGCLYISSYAYGKLIALDLKSGKHLWEVKVGGKAGGRSKVKENILINTRAGIIRVDLAAVWKNQ